MLNTDLKGFWEGCKNNKIVHLFVLLCVCIFLYSLLSKYMQQRSDFTNIMYVQGMVNNMNGGMNTNLGINGAPCNKNIPRLDEAMIRDTINLPNRNPALLTSSMVIPESPQTSDEEKRRTRMDILNMFYSSFDDDLTSIKARPQNLYIIP
jgi:hypothetical protein